MGEPAGKTILIIEDDADMAEVASIVLEAAGYQTRRASCAEEGLHAVHAQKPDLILLDIMMPTGAEGFHFVWDLRQDEDPACRTIPIVVMSAIHKTTRLRFYPEQSDAVYGPGEYLPVQGFLDKPASSEQLVAAVERALAEAASAGGK